MVKFFATIIIIMGLIIGTTWYIANEEEKSLCWSSEECENP